MANHQDRLAREIRVKFDQHELAGFFDQFAPLECPLFDLLEEDSALPAGQQEGH